MKTTLLSFAVLVALVGLGLGAHVSAQSKGKKASEPLEQEGLRLNKDARAALLETLKLYHDQIKSVQAAQFPIGTITPFVGDPRALPGTWQVCDGSALKDPTSPLRSVFKDGRVPNLNGTFLRGTVQGNELLKKGGQAQQQVTVQLPVNVNCVYVWRRDGVPLGNFNLFARQVRNDPRDYSAFVTGGKPVWGQIGDMAQPGVRGNTGAVTYPIHTVPPFTATYYIIRIK